MSSSLKVLINQTKTFLTLHEITSQLDPIGKGRDEELHRCDPATENA